MMSVTILHIICSEGETTSVELNQFAICVVSVVLLSVVTFLLCCIHIYAYHRREKEIMHQVRRHTVIHNIHYCLRYCFVC